MSNGKQIVMAPGSSKRPEGRQIVIEKWKKKELGDIAHFFSGGTPSKSISEYWGNDIPWITVRDMKALYYSKSTLSLTEMGASTLRVMPAGTIYILVRGMGLFKDLPVLYCDRPATFNQDVKAIIPKEGIDPEFLAYSLIANKSEILRLVDSAGHGTGRLDTDLLKSFLFVIPPSPVQSDVVRILRTWDQAIEKATRLAEQGRRRYNAMRRTLTVFARGGREYPSAHLAEITNRIRRKNDGKGHPVMTVSAKSGFLLQSDKYARDMAGSSVDNYVVLHRGEFAYNKGNSLTSPQGCIFRLDEEMALVPHVYFCFAMNDGLHADFFVHLFESGYLNHQLSRVINSGVRNDGLLNLNPEDFFRCRVPLPPLKEQIRIASVLNDLRREIDLQEKYVESLKEQKRGLMQKLLTGKRRVKIEGGSL